MDLMPLISNSIYRTEFQEIESFCIKKLNVKDRFKLNDRYEGKQFLDNTLVNYLILKLLFEKILFKKINNNSILDYNYKQVLSKINSSFIVTDNFLDIIKLLPKNDIVFLVNKENLNIKLYSQNKDLLNELKIKSKNVKL